MPIPAPNAASEILPKSLYLIECHGPNECFQGAVLVYRYSLTEALLRAYKVIHCSGFQITVYSILDPGDLLDHPMEVPLHPNDAADLHATRTLQEMWKSPPLELKFD